jgi:hypothetical protein
LFDESGLVEADDHSLWLNMACGLVRVARVLLRLANHHRRRPECIRGIDPGKRSLENHDAGGADCTGQERVRHGGEEADGRERSGA